MAFSLSTASPSALVERSLRVYAPGFRFSSLILGFVPRLCQPSSRPDVEHVHRQHPHGSVGVGSVPFSGNAERLDDYSGDVGAVGDFVRVEVHEPAGGVEVDVAVFREQGAALVESHVKTHSRIRVAYDASGLGVEFVEASVGGYPDVPGLVLDSAEHEVRHQSAAGIVDLHGALAVRSVETYESVSGRGGPEPAVASEEQMLYVIVPDPREALEFHVFRPSVRLVADEHPQIPAGVESAVGPEAGESGHVQLLRGEGYEVLLAYEPAAAVAEVDV